MHNMEVTLQDYMKAYKLETMPQAKYHLLQHKKKGHLFFKEDVASMLLEQKFQLYYFLSSNSQSEKSAFPIPKNRFTIPKCNDELYETMKLHFESYYLDQELDKEGFGEFDLKNAYIGEDYVWVYKRTS